ncbi:MAG: hypothetical protein E4H09_04095 [Spirochaetales bacterium]|nr:MAG: hypothetical protein E4H09_04095 [Spirochaetales bacterium]
MKPGRLVAGMLCGLATLSAALLIAACGQPTYPLTTDIVVANATELSVLELYVRATDDDSYGFNQLVDPFSPGGEFTITVSKMVFDLLIVYDGGIRQEVAAVDATQLEILEIRLE